VPAPGASAAEAEAVTAVSFDRAAGYYDATRGLPDEVIEVVIDVLAAEAAGKGRCVEIGVGTGRIALPLARRGVTLIGADIAEAMLRRLVHNAGERLPFPLLRADSTVLPLAGGSVGAVVASHVLHLIPDWEAAVDEAVRVLRPGGPLLVDFGGTPRAPWHEWSVEHFAQHGIVRSRPGASEPSEVSEHLGERARTRQLAPVELTIHRSLGQDLDEWERQIHSWTWPYASDQMRSACAALRARARVEGRDLDEEVGIPRIIQWWAFDRLS
jgi:ubiquinone/menaquinone biosynthesis C-methylase UbiE